MNWHSANRFFTQNSPRKPPAYACSHSYDVTGSPAVACACNPCSSYIAESTLYIVCRGFCVSATCSGVSIGIDGLGLSDISPVRARLGFIAASSDPPAGGNGIRPRTPNPLRCAVSAAATPVVRLIAESTQVRAVQIIRHNDFDKVTPLVRAHSRPTGNASHLHLMAMGSCRR